jgi:hypothetical protein
MELAVDIAALLPRYDSAAEEWWARYGALLLASELGQEIVLTQYHPMTFHLPGGTYTPDFLHVSGDGKLYIIEIKGSRAQKNYRDARAKLRAAADLYRWATFYEALIGRNGCQDLEKITI